MVNFIIGCAIMIIALCLMIKVIVIWIDLLDNMDDDYCYDCKQGLCMETPKSDQCQKWREQQRNENQSK